MPGDKCQRQEEFTNHMRFSDLGLSPELLQAVDSAGYETPTPIQAQAIPSVLEGRDVLGIAQTGTGKTASFTLPMIEKLSRGRARARMPRSLILEPTRELADQVSRNFVTYGKNHKLNMALLIGGVSFEDQLRKLDRGVDVLIATPGRLLDHFERGKLMLTGVQIMVIDEADRMLDMGFIPDIERICKLIPFTRQTLFFSATMPPEIQRLTSSFLHNPVRIEVARPASTVDSVKQILVKVSREPKIKRAALRQLLQTQDVKNAIIFCNRKRDVDTLNRSLNKHGFNASALHGDLDQSVRMRTLKGFRDGEINLLIASDVAARGLDIPDVSHVFNFDVPTHSEDYVHRIGRTGRAGRSGHSITIATPQDSKYLEAIEKLIGKPIERITLSDAADATPVRESKPRKSSPEKHSPSHTEKTESDTAQKKAPAEQTEIETPPEPEKRHRSRSRSTVIGLGDHTPAFLLRPVSLPKNAKVEPETDNNAEAPH